MTGSIRTILSPLLITSYVFGIRIVEFPAGKPRLWLGSLYILLLWLVFYFFLIYKAHYIVSASSTIYHICLRMDIFTAMLSTILGLYHNKKFTNCLRRLTIVDNTLEKLNTVTDYKKLHTKVLLIVFGWLVYVVWKTCSNGTWWAIYHEFTEALFVSFILHYCSCVNILDDLIIACIFGYIELKFDQINEYIQKSERINEHEIKSNDLTDLPRHTGYPKSKHSEDVTWIVMHLHLELRRISRELDSIFGLSITTKMGRYFAYTSLAFREIFNIIFIINYLPKIVLFTVLVVTSFISNIFRLFLINYICERVSIKANATGDFINQIPHCSYDIIVRENILQLTLQLTQAPVRFYGLGLFQFGLKFLYGFCTSVATVAVILIQSHTNRIS